MSIPPELQPEVDRIVSERVREVKEKHSAEVRALRDQMVTMQTKVTEYDAVVAERDKVSAEFGQFRTKAEREAACAGMGVVEAARNRLEALYSTDPAAKDEAGASIPFSDWLATQAADPVMRSFFSPSAGGAGGVQPAGGQPAAGAPAGGVQSPGAGRPPVVGSAGQRPNLGVSDPAAKAKEAVGAAARGDFKAAREALALAREMGRPTA